MKPDGISVEEGNNRELEDRPHQESRQPADAEVLWWLQVGMGAFRLRALYDPGAPWDPIGFQLASTC